MSRRIFIDGMNVIRSNLSLEKIEASRGNAEARNELVRLVRDYIARSDEGAEWTVVFDGGGEGPGNIERSGPLVIVYSGERTADEVIVEAATDSVALAHETRIVTNDAEVTAQGAQQIRSEEFYEDLIRRPPVVKEKDETKPAKRLIDHLAAAGHLPAAARDDARLLAELAALLDYFSDGHIAANKLTRKLESFFREHAAVSPSPDPQKKFLRALKAFLEKK